MLSCVRSFCRGLWMGLFCGISVRSNGRRRAAPFGDGFFAGAAVALEDRALLSTITVTSAADASGAHAGVTLRDALDQANRNAGADTIVFATALNGTTIKLAQGQLNITDDVTIRGNGAPKTAVDAHGLSRVFNVSGDTVDVTFDSLTVTGGKTTAAQQSGGGIRFFSKGALNVVNSAITGNTTTGLGSLGGGIYSTMGSVTVTNSTLSGNKTTGTLSTGGGIHALKGTITLRNSTLSGNSTTGASASGGAISSPFADIILDSSTVARNSATGSLSAGGGIYSRVGHVTLTNSILALNTVKTGAAYPDLFTNYPLGATVVASHSLIGNRQGTLLPPAPVGSPDANGNLVGTPASPIDPKLGVLSNNGGPTKTLALLANSPAMNRGGTTHFTFDQRGTSFLRIVGGTLDMGAFEFRSNSAPTVALSIEAIDAVFVDANFFIRV